MKVWTAAVDADGEARDDGDVAEITKMFGLSGWFAGMRPIVLWERPTPDLAINTAWTQLAAISADLIA